MLRRWWRSLRFYWQVYLATMISFGGIIVIVEVLVEPVVLEFLARHFHLDETISEFFLWVFSIFSATLFTGFVLSHMVTRKMTGMVTLAKRLASGDLSARIKPSGSDEDVFTQLAGVFNKMADALERLLSHEKRLLADISHELRSPLTRMTVAAALLPMKRETDEFDTTVKMIENEIEQMNTLVGILLEQGRERLRDLSDYTLISLSALVGETVSAYSFVAENEDKKIESAIVPNMYVWGHPVRLRMILDNVLSNAFSHTPTNGQIDVIVKESGDRVAVSIRDYGPGVPDKHLPDIFKAFFRVDPSRARNSRGVGLGLALAHDAAIAMGGDIAAVNSHPGLNVTLTLPVSSRSSGRGRNATKKGD